MANSYRILAYSNRLIVSIQQAQDLLNSYLISPRRIYQQQYDSISLDITEQIEIIKNIKEMKIKMAQTAGKKNINQVLKAICLLTGS